MQCACRARTLIEDSDMLHLSLIYMHTRPLLWITVHLAAVESERGTQGVRIPSCTHEPNDSDGL